MPTAVITGGTSGIGRATAELLHARGHSVLVTGSSADSVARAGLPEGITAVAADARSVPELDALAGTARERLGSVDLLFLNAGTTMFAPLEDVDLAAFDDLVAVNLRGTYLTLQRLVPLLADGASVVLTLGAGGRTPGATAVAASKGGLRGLVPALALELAPRRIRVNAVSPGAVDTPIWGDVDRTAVTERIPFGRFASAREIAELVAYLGSDAAAYVTGQDIAIAGGV